MPPKSKRGKKARKTFGEVLSEEMDRFARKQDFLGGSQVQDVLRTIQGMGTPANKFIGPKTVMAVRRFARLLKG